VWVQWVLNYLTDADASATLRRCAVALAPSGRVIVKESLSRDVHGTAVDAKDASVTRTDAHFRRIFAEAGLAVAHTKMQPNLPRAVYPVCMYVLEPDARDLWTHLDHAAMLRHF